MKHIFFILCFAALIGGKAYANENPIPSQILHSFYHSFAEAIDVSWEQTESMTIASFLLNGKKKFAYYNEASELLVVAEPITADHLPEDLITSLKETYSHYTVVEVFKMKDFHGLHYAAVLEAAKEKLLLKSYSESWEITRKTKK